jgi:hypothetical protein
LFGKLGHEVADKTFRQGVRQDFTQGSGCRIV